MNKQTFATFLIIALISQSVFAITSLPFQSKLQKALPQKALEKSHLGRALLNMVTLGSQVKYEQSDLFDAMELLRQSLVDAKEFEDETYNQEESTHQINVHNLESIIHDLEKQIDGEETHLKALSEDLDRENINLAEQQRQFDEAQKNVSSLKQQLQDLEERFNVDNSDYASAIEALNEALSKLRDAQANYENAKFESFAQMTAQFTILAQKVTKSVSKLGKDHLLMVKPAVLVMSQLNSQSEQTLVVQAIEAIRNIRDFLSQGQIDLHAAFDRQSKQLNDQLEIQEQLAKTLNLEVIPGTQSRIEGLSAQINTTNELLNQLRVDLEKNQQNLKSENELWEARTNRHNELMDKFNEEIHIVLQAIQVLRDAYEKESQ